MFEIYLMHSKGIRNVYTETSDVSGIQPGFLGFRKI